MLAINILGRFLINRDNNIRYVALNTLHKVVGQDAQAVQRHRNTIVDCLKDNDSSIRQRALELVYALVNEANVKVLVKELLSYLMACDVEFKDELTQRICSVVEKYATDKEWHVDTIIQTLLVSTSFTSEETVCSMIALITSNPDLQACKHASPHKLGHDANIPVALKHISLSHLPVTPMVGAGVRDTQAVRASRLEHHAARPSPARRLVRWGVRRASCQLPAARGGGRAAGADDGGRAARQRTPIARR